VRIAGVTSATELAQDDFDTLMAFAEHSGFRPLAKGGQNFGNRPGMATDAQLELIRELWREMHRQAECDEAALAGWLWKYAKISSLRFLTFEGACKVITALQT